MGLFPDFTVLMQQAEYNWINSGNGPNDNVNQLIALARKLLGTPKNLQLVADADKGVDVAHSEEIFEKDNGPPSAPWLRERGTEPGRSPRPWSRRSVEAVALSEVTTDIVGAEQNFLRQAAPPLVYGNITDVYVVGCEISRGQRKRACRCFAEEVALRLRGHVTNCSEFVQPYVGEDSTEGAKP